jgi:hypothetical protein
MLRPTLSLGGRDTPPGSGTQHSFSWRGILFGRSARCQSSSALTQLRLDLSYFFFDALPF